MSCFHVTWILLHWRFFHLSVETHMSKNLPQYLEGLCSTCCRQIWRTSFTRSGGSWWKLACRVRSSVWDGSAPRRKYVSTARPFEPPPSDQRAGQQVGVTNRLLGPSKLIRQWQSCFSRAGQSFGWMSVHWSEALDKTVTRVTSRSKLHLLQGEGHPAAFDIKCGVNYFLPVLRSCSESCSLYFSVSDQNTEQRQQIQAFSCEVLKMLGEMIEVLVNSHRRMLAVQSFCHHQLSVPLSLVLKFLPDLCSDSWAVFLQYNTIIIYINKHTTWQTCWKQRALFRCVSVTRRLDRAWRQQWPAERQQQLQQLLNDTEEMNHGASRIKHLTSEERGVTTSQVVSQDCYYHS